MHNEIRELVIFIASPGDLEEERKLIKEIVDKISDTICADHGIRLRVSSSANARRDLGRPQGMINPLIHECHVFIGLLNRRWGSPTGLFSSGFEEEFETAKQCRDNSDRPQMLIYFKQLSQDELADPGKGLQKVIDFRTRLESEHIAYLRTFESLEQFRDQIYTELFAVVSYELKRKVDVVPEGSMSSGNPATTESTTDQTLDEAREQIASTLQDYLNLVRQGQSSRSFDPDRLLLFALAVHKDDELLPVHAANRLYARRKDLVLAVGEHRLWLRTFLTDVSSGRKDPAKRVIPFWYFISPREEWSLSELTDNVLEYLTGELIPVSSGALEILRQIMVKPTELWGDVPNLLEGETSGQDLAIRVSGEVIKLWEELLNGGGRQDTAIEYIADLAMRRDIPLLNSLIAKVVDPTVVAEIKAIRDNINGDASALIELASNAYSSPDRWQRKLIRHGLASIESSNLEKLIVGRHTDQTLRRAAFDELVNRRELGKSSLLYLLAAKDSHLRFYALQYALKFEKRESRMLIGEELAKKTNNTALSELKAIALSLILSAEELEDMSHGETKSIIAWEALCLQADEKSADLVRRVFDTDGNHFAIGLQEEGVKEELQVDDFVCARARQAALAFLTRLPVHKRLESDRERARKEFHRDHWLTRDDAHYALATLGAGQDIATLIAASPRTYPWSPIVWMATLELGGIAVARHLISREQEREAEIGAEWLADSSESSDEELVGLLYNNHGRVRIVALKGLTRRWNYDQLKELALSYRNREGGYYYNVIAELDRVLYAPGGKWLHTPKTIFEVIRA